MGVSTDAIIFYGILIEEDSDVHSRIADYDEEAEGKEMHGEGARSLRFFFLRLGMRTSSAPLEQ